MKIPEYSTKKGISNCLYPLDISLNCQGFLSAENEESGYTYGIAKTKFENNANRWLFQQGIKNNYGTLKCTLVDSKYKTSVSVPAIIASVATATIYILSDLPLGKQSINTEYKFEVQDCFGNTIKTYYLNGKGKKSFGVLDYISTDYLSSKATNNILKKLNDKILADGDFEDINRDLRLSYNYLITKRESAFDDKKFSSDSVSLALQELVDGNKIAAYNLAKKGLDAGSHNPNLYYVVGSIDIENGRYRSGLDALNKMCLLNPTAENYLILTREQLSLDQIDDAIHSLSVAHNIDPSNADVLEYRGKLYKLISSNVLALSDFQESLRLNPEKLHLKKEVASLSESLKVRKKKEYEDAVNMQVAVSAVTNQISQQIQNTSFAISQANRTTTTSQIGNSMTVPSNSATKKPGAKTVKCSLCNGKGWIAGTSTASFSSSSEYYCSECGRKVPSSHSHETCIKCKGKGEVTVSNR